MNPLRQVGMESWIILMQVTRKVYATRTETKMLAWRSRSRISLLLSCRILNPWPWLNLIPQSHPDSETVPYTPLSSYDIRVLRHISIHEDVHKRVCSNLKPYFWICHCYIVFYISSTARGESYCRTNESLNWVYSLRKDKLQVDISLAFVSRVCTQANISRTWTHCLHILRKRQSFMYSANIIQQGSHRASAKFTLIVALKKRLLITPSRSLILIALKGHAVLENVHQMTSKKGQKPPLTLNILVKRL